MAQTPKSRPSTTRGGTARVKAIRNGAEVASDGSLVYAYNANGNPICGAQLRGKTEGRICGRMDVSRNGRCPLHGGHARAGMDHYEFKSGRYSDVLPTNLVDDYQNILEDEELLSLRDNIAIFSTRMKDLLRQLDPGHHGTIWQRMGSTVTGIRTALDNIDKGNSPQEQLELISKLAARVCDLWTEGVEERAIWDEVGTVAETIRRQSETEQKRLVTQHKMITAEEGMVLVHAILDVIRMNVADPDTRASIIHGIGKLIDDPLANTSPHVAPQLAPGTNYLTMDRVTAKRNNTVTINGDSGEVVQ